MDQDAGRFRSTCHRGWGHRWMGHLLKVSTPCSSHSSRWDSSVCGALRYFQLRAETLRLMKMASPASETMEEALPSATGPHCLRVLLQRQQGDPGVAPISVPRLNPECLSPEAVPSILCRTGLGSQKNLGGSLSPNQGRGWKLSSGRCVPSPPAGNQVAVGSTLRQPWEFPRG